MHRASAFFSAAPEDITPRDEARFFGLLKTANNTFKRTGASRLAGVDAALIAALANHNCRVDTVLDLGISSGVTTLELMTALRAAGHPARVTGTDRSVRARLVPLPHGCRALVEPCGHVLQYEVLGRAIRPWERRLDRWTGMALARALVEWRLRDPAVAHAAAGDGLEVALLTPRLRRSGAFQWREDDITQRNEALIGRFDLVRAANLLNRHYFEPAVLRAAVANAIAYLSGPGAWLLVLRTHGAADHRGTLFRMDDAMRLSVVERFGTGSEVEALVLELGGG
ncbi:hypothetical protein DAH66_13555 [Sphingomonas koreensis]|uniref:Uncharacterized protein n=1 Tax=Sphingomonas koreensis TaxID=93064 RepID=A0A430G250_9SPHN|nr:hypothetical protein [Sphingomonas koreensis]RSY82546.1 hypothetical protein DAH66_13555 [Sphingomonas koreensis]